MGCWGAICLGTYPPALAVVATARVTVFLLRLVSTAAWAPPNAPPANKLFGGWSAEGAPVAACGCIIWAAWWLWWLLLLLLLLVELPALLLLLPVGLGLLMTPPPGLILEATYRRPIALLSPGPRGTGLVTKALAEAAPKRTTAAATHKPVHKSRPSDAPMPLRLLLLLLLAPLRPVAPS